VIEFASAEFAVGFVIGFLSSSLTTALAIYLLFRIVDLKLDKILNAIRRIENKRRTTTLKR